MKTTFCSTRKTFAMAVLLLSAIPVSQAQTWVQVSVSATVPAAADIFDQARRVSNSYIDRLRYNSQNGAFQIQSPCDFINVRVRYASDGSGDCAARFWVSSTRPSARTSSSGTERTLSRTGGWTTWADSSALADSGSQSNWLQIAGPNSGQAINVTRVDFSKDTFATPASITFDTPTYGQSQTLSWGAVSREDSGYRIEVDRGAGYVLYANAATGITSTNIPASEFSSMGTRQFRVQAQGSTRRLVSAWRTGTLRTVAKADQADLTLTPSTDHTYGVTRTNTVGGGSGTGATTDSLLGGSATRTSAWNYRADAGSGSYTIRVVRASDANYNAQTNDFVRAMVKANQATVSGSLGSSTIPYTNTTTVTASGGSGTGAYEFRQNGGTGTVNLSGSGGSRTITPTLAGTAILEVRRLGDGNYNDHDWVSAGTLTINKANQLALTLTPPTDHTYGLTRTNTVGGGSGTGAYTDSLLVGSATRMSAWNYRADAGSGSYTIRVVRASDANYNAQTNDFGRTMVKAEQSTVSGSLGTSSMPYTNTTTVTASGGSGTGAYEFRQNGGTGSVGFSGSGSSRTITPTQAGTAIIEVRRLGDGNYNDHAWVSAGTLTISKANQVALTLSPDTTHTYGVTRTNTAGGGSGSGAYSDSLLGGAATRTSAWNYRADAGSGSYTVRVVRASDVNYNAQTNTFTRTMVKAEQATVSGSLGSSTITYTNTTTVTASGGSGTGAYEFRQNGGTTTVGLGGSGSSRTITPNGVGTAIMEVRRLGDGNYNDHAWASAGTLTINRANQLALTLSPATAQTYNTTREYTPGGGSGTGAYGDALQGGAATRMSAWNYRADSGTGSYTVRVVRAADANYNAQTNVFARTLAKAVPTLTTPPTASVVLYGDALSTSTLTGGVVSTAGTFAWTNPSLVPPDGASDQSVTFTPSAPANFENMAITVSVTVVSAMPRRGSAVATFDGRIYNLGGLDADASVFRYQSGQWHTDVNIPAPRGSLAAAEFGGRLYVFGGRDTQAMLTVRSELWAFDGTTWDATPTDLPAEQGRMEHGMAALNGVLYVFGGLNAASQALDTVWAFDGTTWTSAAAMPEPRSGFGFAVHQGRIFVVGGKDAQHAASDAVVVFDGSEWTTATPLPEPLALLAAASTGNRLFAFGGGQRVYSFDGTDWNAEINLPGDRYRLGGASLDGWVYAVGGGSTPDGDAQNSVYRMHSGVLPTEGSVLGGETAGYTVTLSGFNLGSGESGDIVGVKFGNTPAAILSQSAVELVVRPGRAVEGSSGYVDVSVESLIRGSLVAPRAFNYIPLEGEVLIASVTPASCDWNGACEVEIVGETLSAGVNDAAVWLAGVPAAVISESATQIVVRAGTAAAAGPGDVRVANSYGHATLTNGFEYLRIAQDPLVFAPTSPQTNDTTLALSTSGGSGTGAVHFTVLSGPGEMVGGSNLKAIDGTGTITVRAEKEQDDLYFAAAAVTAEVVVAKADAEVVLANLSHTYDGTAKSATPETTPAGLVVNLTYDGSTSSPTNAGTYAVTGTVSDTGWQGMATGTLTIAQGAAEITLSDLVHTYDRTGKYPTAQTDPSDLSVMFTFDGSPIAPTAAGTYAVTGTVSDANWSGSATGTLVIEQAALTVTGATGEGKTYDGTTAAAIGGGSLEGVIGGDTVNLQNASTGIFAQATIGSGIAIASFMELDGASAPNYVLTQPTLSADIAARALSVTGALVNAKAFDGTMGSTMDFGVAGLSGVVAGDEADVALVSNGYAASFASAEVGTHAVAVSGLSLSGAKEANYALETLPLTGRIYRIEPQQGPLAGGNTVAVTNGHEGTVTNILVDGTSTAPASSGSDWFTLIMPVGAEVGAVDFVVQTEADGAFTLPDAYTYNAAGAITAVEPAFGSWTGGVEVVITGSHLTDPSVPTDLTGVTLAGAGVASVVSQSATQIVVVAGVSAAGAGVGDVRVVSAAFGETVLAAAFEYLREERPAPLFAPASPQTFGTTNLLILGDTVGTGAVSFEVLSGPGEIVGDDLLSVTGGSGNVQIRATQAQDDFYFANSVTGSVAAARALASVTLQNLSQVYDGTTKQPTATTVPSGLSMSYTFDGSATVPSNVGSYAVTGTVSDADWQGSAVDVFVISKGTATVSLSNLMHTYDGTAKYPTYQTDPSDLSVSFTYDGSPDAPTNAGHFAVSAIVDDPSWQGSATGTLEIAKAAQAAIVFAPASPQAYGTTNLLDASGGSGEGGFSFERLSGPGRLVVVAGDEEDPDPDEVYLVAEAGSGTIVLRATKSADDNYLAVSATAEVVCVPAPQLIDFALIPDQVATNVLTLAATASSGLTVDFAVDSGPAAIEDLTTLRFTGAGAVTIVASQAGDEQWASAAATNSFNVAKAPATVLLGDLVQSYDGTAKNPSHQTDPSNLPVSLTFDGSATAPTEPGEYAVTGTVVHALYAGEASDTFLIVDMPSMILLSGEIEMPDDAAPSVLFETDFGTVATNESVSVTLSITNNGALAVVITNTVIAGTGSDWLTFSHLPAQVDAGSISNFTAHWAPQGLGAFAPTLTLQNDSMTPAFQINFAGSGVKPGEIGLNASRLSFEAVWGGANPDGQTFTLTNKGASAFAWTNLVSYAPEGGGWLTLTPTDGTQETEDATLITATVELGALDAGIYLATNAVTSPTALNSPVDMVFAFTIAQATQTVAFANPGQQVATDVLQLAATASSGLPVSFSVASGAASLTDGTNLSFTAAGSVAIVAAQAGNVNYAAAPSVTQTFDVVRAPQAALTFTPATPQAFAATQTLSATAGSGTGMVSFAVISGPGRIANGADLVADSGTGAIVVRALKASDALYESATALATVTCARAVQTIAFPQPSNSTASGSSELEATATSGLEVEYSIVSGPGEIVAGSMAVYSGTGQVVVAADQPGNLDYAAAATVITTVAVGRAEAQIELDNLEQRYDGSPKTVGIWTFPGALDVTVTYDGSSTPPSAAGSYAVVATVNDPDYTGSTNGTLDINRAPQEIFNFIPTNGSVFLTTNVVGLSASALSGLPVTFTVHGGPGLIADGTNLTFAAHGLVEIVASQAGNENWAVAPPLTNLYTVHGIPVVGPVTLWRTTNQILKVPDFMLLTNSVDPESSGLGIVWVSPASTNGGTVSLSGRWTTYVPSAGDDSPDFFTFRVRNVYGGEAEGTAEIRLHEPSDNEGPSLNIASIEPSGPDILVRFIGIPGRSYAVQATTNLVTPIWLHIGTCQIGAGGFVVFTDPNPPVSRYYRTAKPE